MSNPRARWFFDMVVEMRKKQRTMEKLYNVLRLENEYEDIVDREIERVMQILDKDKNIEQ